MKRILPTIVLSQFFCTSLWFAGNAIMPDMVRQFRLNGSYLFHLTSAVQLGFIAGTLLFAILSISDRFSPSRVFFVCGVVAALFNLGIVLPGLSANWLVLLRFLTGFMLAGIYPVGMKIAADHYREGLGRSLGFLVGALVLGTAFPHLVKGLTIGMPWRYVVFSTSALAALGGLAMWVIVPDGKDRVSGQRLDAGAFFSSFRNPSVRSAAFGYFGHMWELYTFWVFVPVLLNGYNQHFPAAMLNVPLWSFVIIASGSVSCMLSGTISMWAGVKKTAVVALAVSGCCCFLSPLLIFTPYPVLFLSFLLVWGLSVTADSPMFSTLIAQNVDPKVKGTALTLVNCIGFFITVLSIQLLNMLYTPASAAYIYLILAAGPLFGLLSLRKFPSL